MRAVDCCGDCPNHGTRGRLRNEEQGGQVHVCELLLAKAVFGDAGRTVSEKGHGELRRTWQLYGLVLPDGIDSHCPLPQLSQVDSQMLSRMFSEIRRCRVCGCTDENACMTPHGPCWWSDNDLCSACAEKRKVAP